MGEPLIEKDRIRADELVAKRCIGASDTYRKMQDEDPIGASVTHNGGIDTITGGNGTISQLIGASDTLRKGKDVNPIGAVDTHNDATDTVTGANDIIGNPVGVDDTHSPARINDPIGAVGTQLGANGTSVGVNDTHSIGANDIFDWREWHSLNTLALGLNHQENTPTTTGADDGSDLETSTGEIEAGVVGSDWNLKELLILNRISAKNQAFLLENGLTAQAFVSWLLYAASSRGDGIRDPVTHAVSRLMSWLTCLPGKLTDEVLGIIFGEKVWLAHNAHDYEHLQINWVYRFPIQIVGSPSENWEVRHEKLHAFRVVGVLNSWNDSGRL
jgi:hypothetical protein